jgi:hypothetical protein
MSEIGKQRVWVGAASYPAARMPAWSRRECHVVCLMRLGAMGKGSSTEKSVFVSQLLQKYQVMHDCPGHGGMLPIGNAKLLGGR